MRKTTLEGPLKEAGVNVDRARLIRAAESVLRGSKWKHDVAIERFVRELNADAKLLRALHQISEDQSRELASLLLAQLIDDAKGLARERVSLGKRESQRLADRPAPAPSDSVSSRASLDALDSHDADDRPTTPVPVSKGGASQKGVESHPRIDRPSRSTSITRVAAESVARSSVFDAQISETISFRWGDITRDDYDNLRIKNAWATEVERGLAPLMERAPDRHTPIRKFVSESEMRRVIESANSKKQATVAAVRALIHA